MKPLDENNKLQSYSIEKKIAEGSFAVVYQASVQESNEKVAIKKALQEKKYKNRELSNFKILGDHPNIVSYKNAFYVVGQNEQIFINYVLEYMPESLYDRIKIQKKGRKPFTNLQIQVIAFQLLRGLAYMHGKNLAHRDIKPQNILLDNLVAKYCDFGSAKIIQGGQINTSYLCHRHYRPPELIFGATDYTLNVDIWSLGCVFAEMILLEPLFPGESSIDQLVEIIKVLGTPTQADIAEMNISNTEYRFPSVKTHPWSKVFLKYKPDPNLVDLIKKMIVYQPQQRIKPFHALLHPYFQELREEKIQDIPDLWNFTSEEENIFGTQALKQRTPIWRN